MTLLCNSSHKLFNKNEAQTIFKNNERYLNCPFEFDDLIKNDWFFTVINDDLKTVGICYVLCEMVNGIELPFYSGASYRKHHFDMIKAHEILLNLLFQSYDKVFTWTPHLHGKIFNKQAKMVEDKENPHIFYKEKTKWAEERKNLQACQVHK
ncbi:MAG: hypothetical protein BWY78_00678 [Alphaproteobacteria bacterium ADurb.Bin438]|nr:MAG: hypothetical protein BWY78_00678 [Alphaproteobacteria bacterium ADurb.Bin438]